MASNPQSMVDLTENKNVEVKKKSSLVTEWCSAHWKAILSELISTMFLLLFGCMSCIPIDHIKEQSPLYSPLGFGLTVMINIQIFGHLSGAHMNPAVTLSAVIWGSTPIAVGVAFFIVQCLGAIIGYGILIGLSHVDVVSTGVCVTSPHLDLNVYQVLGVEIMLTASLVFLNCGVWDPANQHKQDSVPIKFGLAIVGLSIIGGPLTGASMNPARSLGPAVWTGIWYAHWTYWVGPIVGSILSVMLYKSVWLKNI